MGKKKESNVVCCLNAETGKSIWQFSFENLNETQSTPAVDDTAVYALSKDGILICLEIQKGRPRWKKNLVTEYGAVKPFYGFAGSPVIEGDLVILTVNTAGMALKRQTGELVWTSDPPPKEAVSSDANGTDYSTPVVYSENGKRAALIYGWNGLSSMAVETGKQRWVFRWNHYYIQAADPVLNGNQVLLVADWAADLSRQSVLLAIQGKQPAVLWKSSNLFSDMTTPVVHDGCIYSCHGGSHSVSPYASIKCLELKTGKLLWERFPGGRKFPDAISLMEAAGKLIVLYRSGQLFLAEASPAGFTPLSHCDVLEGRNTVRLFYTPPVLCNGRIYCRNGGGDLVCIDVRR